MLTSPVEQGPCSVSLLFGFNTATGFPTSFLPAKIDNPLSLTSYCIQIGENKLANQSNVDLFGSIVETVYADYTVYNEVF